MKHLLLGFCTMLLVIGGCADPQTKIPVKSDLATQTPPAACQEPEYRQMDFWTGDWALSWDNGDGTTGTGTNIVTRDSHGDCVITENFDGGTSIALRGLSVSTYSKPHKKWRQSWVDNQGGYFALYGGPQEDGTFILEMERLGDKGPFSRMVFEDIEEDSLVWRWQGKSSAADEWRDQWVINYVRK